MAGKKKKRKRILVVSASAGHGHVIAADAIGEALSRCREQPEVDVVDILQYSTGFYRGVIRDAYMYLAKNNPQLFGYLYYRTNAELDITRERTDRFFKLMEGLNTSAFRKYLKKNPPDHLVTTHYLPPQIIIKMREKKKLRCPVTTVTTDYGLHVYWVSRGSDYYITADHVNKLHLMSAGIAEEKIFDKGIPVRRSFAKHRERDQMRKKMKIGAQEHAVLILGGGFGVGPVRDILREMDTAASPFQIFVIAGRNEKLKKALEEDAKNINHKTRVVGYTEKIDEYMRACDLLVTKPGGLTVAEALSVGLPIMIVNPIPGQEDLNSDMLLEEGAAVKAFGTKQIAFKVDAVFGNEEKLTWLRRNAARLGKPEAADHIARFILDHCQE